MVPKRTKITEAQSLVSSRLRTLSSLSLLETSKFLYKKIFEASKQGEE